MSLIRALSGRESRADVAWGGVPPFPTNGQSLGVQSFAGMPVTAESAMRHSAVWACVRLIAGTIGQMPLSAVRSVGGIQQPVSPTPKLLASPSAILPRSVWVEALLTSLLLKGNAYGIVTGVDASGVPLNIELLNPSDVTVKVENGRIVYEYLNEPHTRFPNGDIWHVAAFVMPGTVVGLSPIEYAKQTIGQGLAAEKFGALWFAEGGVPAAVLSTDQTVTEEQAQTIKSRFLNAVKGRREPAVLGAGFKYDQISVSPEESQFLDTMRFSAEQVCRVFGIAPEMLSVGAGSGTSVTYANREQRVSDFLAFGLGPWLNRIEEALSAVMTRPVSAKFTTGAILRADVKTRYEVYELAARVQAQTGTPLLTTDEMRALENLPPLDESGVDATGDVE